MTVILLDGKAGLVVPHSFNDAAATCGDDRCAGGHRFDRRCAERFVPNGREHEHICSVVVINQFRPRQKAVKSNFAGKRFAFKSFPDYA